MTDSTHRIGVISDTHGILRPEVLEFFRGCERIIHAGDVGEESIVGRLKNVAPLDAVRGNVDIEPWAQRLPETLVVEIGGLSIYVLHDLLELDLEPAAAGIDVVVHGHSHRPTIEYQDDVMFLNPGSAGPRRFHLPVSVALLRVRDGKAVVEIMEITR